MRWNQSPVIGILYTNYRGETSQRQIVPAALWWGATSWHPEPQWVIDAYDLDKGATRSFAVRDIRQWVPK